MGMLVPLPPPICKNGIYIETRGSHATNPFTEGPQPFVRRCNYCKGETTSDSRGNCAACGAPRGR